MIYRTDREKYDAILDEIREVHETGRPILVGTTSIEKSELIAEMLQRHGITHQVLNAKYHEREAEIVAQAGRKGAVTIATNMAGRGTDIILGGNPEFMAWADLKRLKDEDGRPLYPTRLEVPKDVWDDGRRQVRARDEGRGPRGRRGRAACTSSAPSGTRAGGSTTSSAAAPAARATPARRGSSSRSKTT